MHQSFFEITQDNGCWKGESIGIEPHLVVLAYSSPSTAMTNALAYSIFNVPLD